MKRIWIAQIMCPENHCILAIAFDERRDSPWHACASLLELAADLIEQGRLAQTCPACGASEWHSVAIATMFPSMSAAEPFLPQLETARLTFGELVRIVDGE